MLEHFLSSKMTPYSWKLINVIRSYNENCLKVLFIFAAYFHHFLENISAAKSTLFDALHHIFRYVYTRYETGTVICAGKWA